MNLTQRDKAISNAFTPALGHHWLTPAYDLAIAALTREAVWRKLTARHVAATAGDRILDVGCGTGTLAAMIAQGQPNATVFGIDPDPNVLERARRKASDAGVSIRFIEGFLSEEVIAGLRPLTKVISSLVLHQVPLPEKKRILALMRGALPGGGQAYVADYGAQATPLMRWLFRQTVQRLDGMENTQPNADGVLKSVMHEAGFRQVDVLDSVPTPTGSISIYRCIA